LAGASLYPELTLSAPLRGHRLLARFDLLAVLPNSSLHILDWKTARQKPPREALARRLQTRLYPYVLAQAGAAYNGGQPVDPAAITITYWYPTAPTQPETFAYSPALLARDEQYLSELIEQIKQAASINHFPLVESSQPCAGCVYRSLCNRGQTAGPLTELDDAAELFDLAALDWEQVAEIQF
jgi:hypothetical protein